MLLTLEQINLTEEEVGTVLNFIYESEEHPEKDMYAKFIDEATLDQKLSLLTLEADKMAIKAKDPSKQGHIGKGIASAVGAGLFGVFWVAYRIVRAIKSKCSRKCSVVGLNTLLRQKCMAECNVTEAKGAMAAAGKVQCKGDAKCETKKKEMLGKWKEKLGNAANKAQAYKEKHKKVAFTM